MNERGALSDLITMTKSRSRFVLTFVVALPRSRDPSSRHLHVGVEVPLLSALAAEVLLEFPSALA